MKHLTLALLLLATPAYAGGVYDHTVNDYILVGETETVTFQRNLAAGSVDEANVMRWRGEFQGAGSVRFVLDGDDLTQYPIAIVGPDVVIELEVQRVTSTSATTRIWVADATTGGALAFYARRATGNLGWTRQQTAEIRLAGGVGGVGQMFVGLEK